MVTVNKEIVKISYGLSIGQYGGQLIYPSDWVLADLAKDMMSMPSEADLFTETVGQHYPIGTQLRKNGKLYRYCKAGEAMTTVGFLKGNYFQCPGKAGNNGNSGYEAAAYAALVADQTYVDITDTAAAKNEYENAYGVVYDDTNNYFDDYTILGNDASDGTFTRLYIAPPGIKTAKLAAKQWTIYRNPYMGIRQKATCGSYGSALGWAKFPITSAYYFWLQTAGPISGLTGASTWPGQTAHYRDVYSNTDGSLIGYTAGYQRVGYLLSRTASDYGDNFIMLQLDQ